ncbi:MAG: 4Fe-4S binding protein [Candidatus Promineofilum sp.]|nr:4Fe-4S binding protein [Promineifilum sp.]
MKIALFTDLARSAFRRPVTERYPFEKRPAPPLYRGQVSWTAEGCTGCMLCVKDCPAEAIDFFTLDKANKRFVFRYHTDRCTFCGQCAYSCRFSCITLDDEAWELAGGDRAAFVVTYGRPEDIARVELEELPATGA